MELRIDFLSDGGFIVKKTTVLIRKCAEHRGGSHLTGADGIINPVSKQGIDEMRCIADQQCTASDQTLCGQGIGGIVERERVSTGGWNVERGERLIARNKVMEQLLEARWATMKIADADGQSILFWKDPGISAIRRPDVHHNTPLSGIR